jgi:S1-C subfamily serine protease
VKHSTLLLTALVAAAGPLAAIEGPAPRVIDDLKLMQQMRDGLGKLADDKKGTDPKKLQEAARKAPRVAKAAVTCADAGNSPAIYDDLVGSVAALSSVYKCGKCSKWHLSGSATTWCLAADGVFVTNYHVFESPKGAVMGVCTVDGKVAAVTEILAADRAADVCIYRVDGAGFRPLALAPPVPVGTKVRVISHPEGRFFFQSSGEIGRYHRRPGRGDTPASTWMSVTADFARGSSGGPVVDELGRVVGMVSNTQSIYYEASGKEPKGPLQMVVKNCVPVESIRRAAGLEQAKPAEVTADASRD